MSVLLWIHVTWLKASKRGHTVKVLTWSNLISSYKLKQFFTTIPSNEKKPHITPTPSTSHQHHITSYQQTSSPKIIPSKQILLENHPNNSHLPPATDPPGPSHRLEKLRQSPSHSSSALVWASAIGLMGWDVVVSGICSPWNRNLIERCLFFWIYVYI